MLLTHNLLALDDDEDGHAFHSKYFPKLQYFLHTGFDLEVGEFFCLFILSSWVDFKLGCHNFKRWMVNTPEKPQLVEASKHVTDDLPLYRRATCKFSLYILFSLLLFLVNLGNLEISNIFTQKEVHEQKLWPWAENVITKTYFEL